MKVVRNAIFDLDGTLIDSLPGIAWSIGEALTASGLKQHMTEFRLQIGPPIRSILSLVSGLSDAHSLDELERAFRRSYDGGGWHGTACYAGVRELLEDLLAQGVRLWVVTNKPALPTRNILRHLKLDTFFEGVVCRDSRAPAWGSKSDALIDLLDRRGLSRETCLLIGDTPEDRRAAVAAGLDCIIVAHGYGAGEFFSDTDWSAVRGRFIGSAELAEVG